MRSSLLLALSIVMACAKPSTPPPSAPPAAPVSGPRVILPDGNVVHVEIAADDASRQQGLMYRDRVREGTGMLFMFPQTGNYPFWMKNTLIPLDMIWIDEQKRIVHVTQDVPPCQADPCPSYPPGADARYVLELAAGVARQHGVVAGADLRFEGIDAIVVR
jgi:uncharacterized membrane protein (UPF0127 family)